MFKKILVPTDGSKFSQKAYRTALEIGELSKAEIILLHVISLSSTYWRASEPFPIVIEESDLEETAQEVLNSTVEGVDQRGLVVRMRKESGYPAQVIIDMAEDEGVDLIVMGNHGYSPFVATVLGSVSQRVLYGATCPVLIVKEDAQDSNTDIKQ
ncbi:universal stress protein [Desulfitobacterium sp. Sab5]|uniref:universal stress protein n=1 Tax=Desulfitobacterium nosdiversum TaxID=3375356 RepID=UPI003CEC771A